MRHIFLCDFILCIYSSHDGLMVNYAICENKAATVTC